MKLAAALMERSDIQRKLSELSGRLNKNAKVQEGDRPAEEPKILIAEINGLFSRLEWLIAHINLTNSNTVFEGKSMTELLAHRDCLKQRIMVMREFLSLASEKVERYSVKEIKISSTVVVAEEQKHLDRLSKELRELDEKIQEYNWTAELI